MTSRLDRKTKLLYGCGAIAFGIKDNGFSFFLLLYYDQVLGLPHAWVGLGIMAALVIDACVDPLIGHLSDHHHARLGRRHPFMYAAAAPVALFYWLLWNPPTFAPPALFAYFVVVAVVVRIAISVYEIPSASLAAELTRHYDERTALFAHRYFFGWWGGLGIMVLAYAVFLQPDARHAVGVLNPEGYRRYGLAAALCIATAILVSAAGTHRFIPQLARPPTRPRLGVRGVARELRETLGHRPFLTLFGATTFAAVAVGLQAALAVYVNTYFWELTSSQISVLVVSSFLAAAVALVATPRLGRRAGKKAAALGVSLAGVAIGPSPIFLRLADRFPENGAPTLVPTLFAFNLVTTTLVIMSGILTSSMTADVVEDSELVTGRRSEGVFVAANAFVQKAVSGVGIFASALVLDAIGFPRDARPGSVDPAVVRALGWTYGPALVVLYLIAIGFLAAYPIDRARHVANLARLAERRPR